jgi:hypothetical protein
MGCLHVLKSSVKRGRVEIVSVDLLVKRSVRVSKPHLGSVHLRFSGLINAPDLLHLTR